MSKKWTTRYGLAAVITAILIIAVAMFATPSIAPKMASAKATFTVMLTDPPTVPAGTTGLNITYSGISLDVTYPNGTSNWLSLKASGTVNSFALINMTQTIATTTIPTNTTVDKIEFMITNASAVINGQEYNVTTLSNTLVMSIANSQVNQTLSGVLIDFNPTLVQIQATDANGNPVDYYVLVPSATAVIVNQIDQSQVRVGTIVSIGENDRTRIHKVVQSFADNLTVTSASLSVNGNTTNLSITLQNNGDVAFRVFGIMLQGNFNSTLNQNDQWLPRGNHFDFDRLMTNNIPFEINGTSLVPLIGDGVVPCVLPQEILHGPMMGTGPMNRFGGLPYGPQNGVPDDRTGQAAGTYLVLEPGQTVTMTFSGVIALQNSIFNQDLSSAIVPTVGNSYTISLTGEGFQSFNVTATA